MDEIKGIESCYTYCLECDTSTMHQFTRTKNDKRYRLSQCLSCGLQINLRSKKLKQKLK